MISENCEMYAVKEVYLKHVDDAVKNAYVTEINFLKRLKNFPEVVTLHSWQVGVHTDCDGEWSKIHNHPRPI